MIIPENWQRWVWGIWSVFTFFFFTFFLFFFLIFYQCLLILHYCTNYPTNNENYKVLLKVDIGQEMIDWWCHVNPHPQNCSDSVALPLLLLVWQQGVRYPQNCSDSVAFTFVAFGLGARSSIPTELLRFRRLYLCCFWFGSKSSWKSWKEH